MKNKVYYRRNLPHIQPPGELFFVTWTLKGAIPKEKRREIQSQHQIAIKNIKDKEELDKTNRIFFKKYDEILHHEQSGNHYLKNKRLAKIVADALHYWDNKRMELIAYCIMSNHVHLVLRMFYKDVNDKILYLRDVLSSIKRYTSRQCNKVIGKTGNHFWQDESYDRHIRDDAELERIIQYVLNNPVKANLCKSWEDWEFSYIADKYRP